MMREETIQPGRGTNLRKNANHELRIFINSNALNRIFLVNGTSFFTQDLKKINLVVKPNDFYMVINKWDNEIKVKYSTNISNHKIIYQPYQYEFSKKEKFDPAGFSKEYNVPSGYIDILNKWYSIKFTYPDYNLIYIKPEIGISIQIHQFRNEHWKILEGNPIIINANQVHYFVEKGTEFLNTKMTYHSALNPNKNPEQFVIIEEKWAGKFDEEDITRVFNPNNYH
jgi:mannose-6-phosphate isomerase-like protein (cupin superfamily)